MKKCMIMKKNYFQVRKLKNGKMEKSPIIKISSLTNLLLLPTRRGLPSHPSVHLHHHACLLHAYPLLFPNALGWLHFLVPLTLLPPRWLYTDTSCWKENYWPLSSINIYRYHHAYWFAGTEFISICLPEECYGRKCSMNRAHPSGEGIGNERGINGWDEGIWYAIAKIEKKLVTNRH